MSIVYRIYLVTCLKTDEKYVGRTINTVKHRWSSHRRHSSPCRLLNAAIKKYGAESFKITEVFNAFSKIDQLWAEKYFISFYKSMTPFGYNIYPPTLYHEASKEARIKMSIAQKKNWDNPERRREWSEIQKKIWQEDRNRKKRLRGISKYVKEKRTPIVRVEIFTKKVTHFKSAAIANSNGFTVGAIYQCLNGRCAYAYESCWFYKEKGLGKKDYIVKATEYLKKRNFYEHLPIIRVTKSTGNVMHFENLLDVAKRTDAKINMVRRCLKREVVSVDGFHYCFKGESIDWSIKRPRPKKTENIRTKGFENRRTAIVGVSRFDGSIVRFPGLHDAERAGKGFRASNICQVLSGECHHAFNYCWIYDEGQDDKFFFKEAKKRLGSFDDSYNRTIERKNVSDQSVVIYEDIYKAREDGFSWRAIMAVIKGRRKTYKGYIWSFKS
jgi:GIY-YIG catalytic domain